MSRDELDFLDGLGPRRVSGNVDPGFRNYLLVFPKARRASVSAALVSQLPKRGWTLAWSEPGGDLQFVRDHYRESIDFTETNSPGVTMSNYQLKPDDCVVDVSRRTTWAERQIDTAKRWLHLP